MPPKAKPAAGARARSKSGARKAGAAPAPKAAIAQAAASVGTAGSAADAPAAVAAPTSALDSYSGTPLAIAEAAEALRASCTDDVLRSLAETAASEEQLPPRLMLEYLGDEDTTWANAQKSLGQGKAFVKEILDMEGAQHVTKGRVARLEALGTIVPDSLKDKHPAAFAMAVYLEAVLAVAKAKLGLVSVPPEAVLRPPTPPGWPIKIKFTDVAEALKTAVHFNKTALILCSGKCAIVDTFFQYQADVLIDAKWMLGMVDIKKEMDMPTMRQELRKRLMTAIKYAKWIHIAMQNTAVSMWKYCDDDTFPASLFKAELWIQKENYSRVIREQDLKDWPGACPGKMREESPSLSFITSDFSLESAQEFLPTALPHFDSMAIIEIDPDSIN